MIFTSDIISFSRIPISCCTTVSMVVLFLEALSSSSSSSSRNTHINQADASPWRFCRCKQP